MNTHYNAGSPDATYTNYWQTAGTGFDSIKVTGNLVLGTGGVNTPTLLVRDNGGTYNAGDIFKLLDWASVGVTNSITGGGGFIIGTDLVLPDLTSFNLAWDTSAFGTYGVVVVVPEPGRAMLLLLGAAALLMRRRRNRKGD